MLKENFHEKISLVLSLLILNNYFLLSISVSTLFIKINFLIFLATIFLFYIKNSFENIYLKIFFILIVIIALGTPTTDWDPRSIWLFHAKRIFYDGSIFSVADNYAPFSNNEYPSVAPAFATSLAYLIGHWNEVFPKLGLTFLFLPPLVLVYVFLTKTQYLIFLSIVFFTIGKFLINGWMDGLVAIYFGVSALLMYLLMTEDQKIYKKKYLFYYLSFCFFISLTLLKDEGSVLLLILFISAFLVQLLKKEFKQNILKLIFLSISFLPIILWKLFCYSEGLSNHHINIDLSILPRFFDLNNYLLTAYFIFLNEKFIICFLFFLLSFWLNWDKKIFNFISVAILMYLFTLFFVFLSTPFDFYWQLDSTAARLVRTLNFSLAFFGLYNLREKIKDF